MTLRKSLPRSTRSAPWRKAGSSPCSLLLLVASLASAGVPARSQPISAAPNAVGQQHGHAGRPLRRAPGGLRLVRGAGAHPPLVDPDAVPASLCDPKDPGNCVDFCSRLAPECAVAVAQRCRAACCPPSRSSAASCSGATPPIARRRGAGARHRRGRPPRRRRQDQRLVPGHGDRRRGLGQGRQLSPAAARRALELLRARQPRRRWRPRSPSCASTSPGRRRATSAWRPRTSSAGASSAPRASRSPARPFTPSAIPTIRSRRARRRAARTGRSCSAASTPSATSCARRSSAGCPSTLKWPVTAPAARVGFKLVRTGVIQGQVIDADGDGQPNATVVALLSGGLGAAGSPIIWTVDTDGQVRAGPLPARHVLPVGAPRRDAGVPAREDRDQRPGAGGRDRAEARRTRGRACAGSVARSARGRADRARDARRAVRPLAAGAAAQGGRRDRSRRQVRRRRAAAGPLRDLGARRLARSCRSRAARARSRSPSSRARPSICPRRSLVRPQAEE